MTPNIFTGSPLEFRRPALQYYSLVIVVLLTLYSKWIKKLLNPTIWPSIIMTSFIKNSSYRLSDWRPGQQKSQMWFAFGHPLQLLVELLIYSRTSEVAAATKMNVNQPKFSLHLGNIHFILQMYINLQKWLPIQNQYRRGCVSSGFVSLAA